MLWHYTNKKGMKGIIDSGEMKPSTDTINDCSLGVGVYFTTTPPYKSDETLLNNNYGKVSNDQTNRVDYAFGIRVQDMDSNIQSQIIKHSGRNVFCVQTDDPINIDYSGPLLWDRKCRKKNSKKL